jgi:hypothetical protein
MDTAITVQVIGSDFVAGVAGRMAQANRIETAVGMLTVTIRPHAVEQLSISCREDDTCPWLVTGPSDAGFSRSIDRHAAIGCYVLLVGIAEEPDLFGDISVSLQKSDGTKTLINQRALNSYGDDFDAYEFIKETLELSDYEQTRLLS